MSGFIEGLGGKSSEKVVTASKTADEPRPPCVFKEASD
jgi:hypothetical protein